MADLMLDSEGDLELSAFDVKLLTGAEAIGQRLRIRLAYFLGEWFLDTSFGVPYFQDVLRKNPDPLLVEAAFKDAILSTPGVLALESFELSPADEGRRLELSFRVLTSAGSIALEEVLP